MAVGSKLHLGKKNQTSPDWQHGSYPTEMQSPDLLRSIFDSISEGIAVIDLKGNILMLNRRLLDIWDGPQEWLEARHISDLVAFANTKVKEPNEYVGRINKLVKHTGDSTEETVELKDGRVLQRITEPYKLDGKVIGRVWLLRDATDSFRMHEQLEHRAHTLEAVNRDLKDTQSAMSELISQERELHKELQQALQKVEEEKTDVEAKVLEQTRALREEHARFEAGTNSLSQGFLALNRQQQVLYYNVALGHLLQLPDRPISFEEISAQMKQSIDLRALSEQCMAKTEALQIPNVEFGTSFLTISLYPTRLTDSKEVIGCVMLLQDVTEQRNVDRSKDEFLSIASHELRTPLTAIKGNTSLIMNYYPEVLQDQTLHEMVDDIHSSSVRLIEIVNDFLDASRLEQDRMVFNSESFNISDVIGEVIKEMGALFKEHKLYLKLKNPTEGKAWPIYADRDRVKQIVYNLVGNASKFTQEGGVSLELVPGERQMKVLVIDTGRGMSAEGQTMLFKRFQQTGDSVLTRDAVRGTGLGLYISKMLIEKMGGSIRLESSTVGKGTTFSFSVPLARPHARRHSGSVHHRRVA